MFVQVIQIPDALERLSIEVLPTDPRMKSSNQDRYGPGGLGSRTGGSDKTDPNSGMGQAEQTLFTLGQTKQTQGQHLARPNRPKTNTGPDRKDSVHGPVRTDPRPTLGQTEKTHYLGQIEQTQDQPWARPNRPKSNPGPDRKDPVPGPDRTDPRPTLGQTEQTQDQHWARPK